ncbi:hypothetical protein BT96DRAFT_991147 [Gymnopus androsaceus JB14]|uniref:Uncharacterized protein n=1 Tax=Gymnopus androsaceus JB14 TaxID=1447944 RepID=A0A6A4I144_9AGAR|nr:hypothetical protein BT96DRAFT_991147 [Gymnopus androsaceus JB14]
MSPKDVMYRGSIVRPSSGSTSGSQQVGGAGGGPSDSLAPQSPYSSASSSSSNSDEDIPINSQMYHPANVINDYILEECKNVDVAITHDDDWCSILDEADHEVPDEVELIRRIEKKYDICINESSGYAYLSLRKPPTQNPAKLATMTRNWRNSLSEEDGTGPESAGMQSLVWHGDLLPLIPNFSTAPYVHPWPKSAIDYTSPSSAPTETPEWGIMHLNMTQQSPFFPPSHQKPGDISLSNTEDFPQEAFQAGTSSPTASDWDDLITGKPARLDHIFASMHATTLDKWQTQKVGEVEFKFRPPVAGKKVSNSGDWQIVFAKYKKRYSEHIIQLFAALPEADQHKVIDYDKAICYQVSQSHQYELTAFGEFQDLFMHWVQAPPSKA